VKPLRKPLRSQAILIADLRIHIIHLIVFLQVLRAIIEAVPVFPKIPRDIQ
jgi:hypothetical protein